MDRPGIVDGDSIRLAGRSIRLEGIAAPEWDQTCLDASGRTWRCGRAASQPLREHLRGRTESCQPRAIDRYGSRIYASAETDAKAPRRGIWDGTFISPASWRHPKSERPHHHP